MRNVIITMINCEAKGTQQVQAKIMIAILKKYINLYQIS